MIVSLFHVALGGAIGACLRYLASLAALRWIGSGFPYGTLLINVAGSFTIGLLVVVLAERDAARLTPFLVTGVLGGFTTFSAFSLETISLVERGQTGAAAIYVLGSVALSLIGVSAGLALARGVLT